MDIKLILDRFCVSENQSVLGSTWLLQDDNTKPKNSTAGNKPLKTTLDFICILVAVPALLLLKPTRYSSMIKHLIVLFLFFAASSLAQLEQNVLKILSGKRMADFDTLVKKLRQTDGTAGGYCLYKRDVVNGFRESIYNLYKSVPDPKEPGTEFVTNYKVYVVDDHGEILYHQFTEEKYKSKFIWWKLKRIWVPYNEHLGVFRNDSLFDLMKSAFKQSFHADLNEQELFSTDYVYGFACGYSGEPPQGKEEIDSLVKTNDRVSLVRWLQSTVTEKQLYGVMGFHDLKQKDVPLDATELELIHNVLKKEGIVLSCSGCTGGPEMLSELTKEFDFN